MVAKKDRDDAKARWSAKLHAALDAVGFAPGRQRTTALQKLMKVSYESARKWLSGEAIPDQTNMQLLAERAKINLRALQVAEPPTEPVADDFYAKKLAGVWRDLPDDVKGQIVGFALVSATTRPSPKKDDPEGQEETGI